MSSQSLRRSGSSPATCSVSVSGGALAGYGSRRREKKLKQATAAAAEKAETAEAQKSTVSEAAQHASPSSSVHAYQANQRQPSAGKKKNVLWNMPTHANTEAPSRSKSRKKKKKRKKKGTASAPPCNYRTKNGSECDDDSGDNNNKKGASNNNIQNMHMQSFAARMVRKYATSAAVAHNANITSRIASFLDVGGEDEQRAGRKITQERERAVLGPPRTTHVNNLANSKDNKNSKGQAKKDHQRKMRDEKDRGNTLLSLLVVVGRAHAAVIRHDYLSNNERYLNQILQSFLKLKEQVRFDRILERRHRAILDRIRHNVQIWMKANDNVEIAGPSMWRSRITSANIAKYNEKFYVSVSTCTEEPLEADAIFNSIPLVIEMGLLRVLVYLIQDMSISIGKCLEYAIRSPEADLGFFKSFVAHPAIKGKLNGPEALFNGGPPLARAVMRLHFACGNVRDFSRIEKEEKLFQLNKILVLLDAGADPMLPTRDFDASPARDLDTTILYAMQLRNWKPPNRFICRNKKNQRHWMKKDKIMWTNLIEKMEAAAAAQS